MSFGKALALCCLCGVSLSAGISAYGASPSQSMIAGGEHPWAFTYFGTSTGEAVNTIKDGSSIVNGVGLTSCSVKGDGSIDKKGGKFVSTDGYDGISYYYTTLDPENENFCLKADITVDYINPTPDGQEGFAILARDSMGEDKVSSKPFYTNSMAAIGTKLSYTAEDGTKSSIKDGVGFRFFSGITSADSAPAKNTFTADNGAFDPSVKIKSGKTYTMILKRTNTGYHALYLDEKGETKEEVYYLDGKEDPLCKIDKDHIYVGFAVARGCNATFSNIEFSVTDRKTDPPAKPHPITYIDPDFKITSASTSGTENYTMVFKTNADGVAIPKLNGMTMEYRNIKAGAELVQLLYLKEGVNQVSVVFVPSPTFEPAPYTKLKSYSSQTITKEVIRKNYNGTVIYVSPNGTSDGEGTNQSPLSVAEAVKYAAPGQSIYLEPGVYKLSELKVERGIDGLKDQMITMETDPQKEGRAVFDFEGQGSGMQLWGSYWHLKNIDITRTMDLKAGLQVAGNSNLIELVEAYDNGNTGIQISGTSEETFEKWPSGNLILNCTSYNNSDAAMEDADGFAAKLTCGEGNVFDGCMAYNNADDGWDFFAKVGSGQIGAVTIKNCVAYQNGYIRKDGQLIEAGNGNGFKMGGSGISGHHVLINSISYENKAKGIDSNSCPDIEIYRSTSYNNRGSNVALYSNKGVTTAFKADGIISYRDKYLDTAERIELNGQNAGEIFTENNYLYQNNKSVNSLGEAITASMFESLDTGRIPQRLSDGTIDMKGLLTLTALAPQYAGARRDGTPVRPVVWVVGDSTVSAFQDHTYYYPRYGWGTQLNRYLKNVKVENLAISGTSSLSFSFTENYKTLLAGMKEGDYLLIGFGHNDEKTEAERFTDPAGGIGDDGSFQNSLYKRYIKKAQDAGATPVLCTPIVRRNKNNQYDGTSGHITQTQVTDKGVYPGGDYAQAIRDLGAATGVTVLDLTRRTKEIYEQSGAEGVKNRHAWTSSKEISIDDTHTNIYGAACNAWIIADEVMKSGNPIKRFVKPDYAQPSPEILEVNPEYQERTYARVDGVSAIWPVSGPWKGTVFGNVGGKEKINKDNFTLESVENEALHIRAGVFTSNESGTGIGKISTPNEGLAMYYQAIPSTQNFTLSADVKINKLVPNNQVSFGIMVRDDMYLDLAADETLGDYVAAGPLGLASSVQTNSFARKNGVLIKGGTAAKTYGIGDTVHVTVRKTDDGYTCIYGENDPVTAGFDFKLTSIDPEYVYAGLFACRNADVTFSNINLTLE